MNANQPRPRAGTRFNLERLEDRSVPAVIADFDFEMLPRTVDPDGDGRFVIPNTQAYANPVGGFDVRFDAGPTAGDTFGQFRYDWTVRTPSGGLVRSLSGFQPLTKLAEGNYTVTLTVRNLATGAVADTETRAVTIDDILVVSMGDSYASGEGSPDVAGEHVLIATVAEQWATGGTTAVSNDHRLAHRSSLAGTAQAALRLEQADRHTSVTYVSVAQSGATTQAGMLVSSPAADNENVALPAQVDQLQSVIGGRRIDALVMSVGGNDIGFANIVTGLAGNTILPGQTAETDPEMIQIRGVFQTKLGQLEGRYTTLNQALRSRFDFNRVYLLEPTDPTTKDDGTTGALFGDAAIGLVSVEEADWARANIVRPLQDKMRGESLRHDWVYVGGISDAFIGHGYPASGGQRYIRTLSESFLMQGDKLGAVHPNPDGHQVYGDFILAAVQKRNDPVPVARLTGPSRAVGGSPIILSATTSTAPNAIVSYEWDFDFDTAHPDDFTPDATGATIAYTPPGAPLERADRVALRITDAAGRIDFDFLDIGIDPTPGAFLVNRTLRVNGSDTASDDIRVSATISTTTVRRGAAIQMFSNTLYDTIVISGFGGDDRLEVEASVNKPATFFGGAGNDTLLGGPRADALDGGDGDDTINGRGGADFILAGTGDDTIILDATDTQENLADVIDAGDGFDGIVIHGTAAADVIRIGRRETAAGVFAMIDVNGRRFETAYGNGETVTVEAGGGDDVVVLDRSAGRFWRAHFRGGAGDDVLIGGGLADRLDGGPGRDLLIGRGGDDTLLSGLPWNHDCWFPRPRKRGR